MAVKSKPSGSAAGSPARFAIGANVALSIIVAAALLIAINLLASYKHWREDLASVGNYGLSDRTRSILDGAKNDIELSFVYEPNDKDKNQREYISRLQEYCDELSGYSNKIKVTHVATDRQREDLVSEISKSMGGEAEGHQKAIEAFERVRAGLEAELSQRVAEAATVKSNPDAWLSGFPLFADVVLKLKEMQDDVVDLKTQIDELVPQAGLPKYGEATTLAKTSIESLSDGFNQIGRLMGRFTDLAKETTKPDSEYVASLREVAVSARNVATQLRDAIGDENAPPPDDLKAPLKAFADACADVAGTLNGLVARVDRFSDAFPIVKRHADWSARVQNGPLQMQIEVSGVFQNTGRSLEEMRLQVLGILDKNAPDELQAALLGVRRNTTSIEQNIAVCEQILTSLADSLSKMDAGSQAMLAASDNDGMFTATLAAMNGVKSQLDELPELTLGDIADKLREPNTIVIRSGGKIRVVPFDDAWPIRDTGRRDDTEDPLRTFNGDSALSTAFLALTADKKFANVIFVGFEPPAPQQRSPFAPPPPRSKVPLAQTNILRERLMAANFNVYQWNLAEQPDAPTVEEGLESIHVFLPPPPPAMPNPFGPQTPTQTFGAAELRKMQDILETTGRGIFLASWEVSASPFGPPTSPEYAYNKLLESKFGLHVDTGTRVISVDPAPKSERGFTINGKDINWLPMIGYSDHPVGKPMQGTRSLVSEACVIDIMEPADKAEIDIESILRIPDREQYIGTSIDTLSKIVAIINDPRVENIIELDKHPTGEFDIVAETDREGRIRLPLGFVPALDAKAAMLTIDGYKFRAPLESVGSKWVEFNATEFKEAGVAVGTPIDAELVLDSAGAEKKETIRITVEAEEPYRIPVPMTRHRELAAFAGDEEMPVNVTLNGATFTTMLRAEDNEAWIPLTESNRAAAKVQEDSKVEVGVRIVGIHDTYFPNESFTTTVRKVASPGYRAKLPYDPNVGAAVPRKQFKLTINGKQLNGIAFDMGGSFAAPVYKSHLAKTGLKAGQRVHVGVELIIGAEPSPFDLVVAATRKGDSADAEDATGPVKTTKDTRIVLMGIGQSFMDGYLSNPVVASFEKIRLDPPPTENLDLFVNAVNWLNDTPEYIGRGPVPVPRIGAISASDQTRIRALLIGVWPAVILGVGVCLWFVRRR